MGADDLETLRAERSITRVILAYARAVDGLDFDFELGRARCETYTTNAAPFRANDQGEVLPNVTGTRYLDAFERRDGEWRILERRNTSIWVMNTIESPTPPPPSTIGSPRQR